MKQSLDWILLEKCTQCDKENKFFVFVDYILMGENMFLRPLLFFVCIPTHAEEILLTRCALNVETALELHSHYAVRV